MPPNTEYEYGETMARRSENGRSGVRYIGRSEMVEFVCHDADTPKHRVTSAKARDESASTTNTKFARVKSPKMRRRSDGDDVSVEGDVKANKMRLRKRCVTFQLDELPVRASTPTESISVTMLPPIDAKPSLPEIGRKMALPSLQKSASLDEKEMRSRMTSLEGTSPSSSPKLNKRSSFTASRGRKSEAISVEKVVTSAPTSPTTKRRFERVDSIIQRMETMTSPRSPMASPRSPMTSPRSPMTSPRSLMTSPRSPMTSPRSARTERSNLFVDLDNIDEYKPDKNRLKFIQAALSSTTSPRFSRPGSGSSHGSGSAPSSGRSSPLSVTQIGLAGECLLPGLDSATGSRMTSASSSPMTSRANSAERRVRRRSTTKSTREMVREAITSLATGTKTKWYD